ncbi:hypothetical protein [Haliscomenobacter hydrossis]|uniref:Uncharacterized protein n=1 Tax=Haliscomenobacter hydrossis (strain ATCC 27775 / DSM 1100 / LMG 10767 / O) TaxID=760192 RepID=F4KQW9_HALH1|nr:hypothetical protein [Haliscomenobacter hydrossis]AEE52254.1 hypothetical protein Halhy_4411 [Haliscomenobacter hydrossis DSM 1100]
MRNILIVTALLLSTPVLLSAQATASFGNVKQAQMDLSTTVRLLEQNILLALTAGVIFLGVIFVCYVIKENANSNRVQQAKRNHFLSLIVLVVGTGIFCSSCGVAQEVQATPSDLAQEHLQRGCPHHHPNQEPLAFVNIYRSIGYPAQRISTCKFCGHRLVDPRD